MCTEMEVLDSANPQHPLSCRELTHGEVKCISMFDKDSGITCLPEGALLSETLAFLVVVRP